MNPDPEPQPVADETRDGEGFVDDHQRDPGGAPLLDRVELTTGVVGAVSSLIAVVLGIELALGWTAGWLACQINVALIRRLMHRVFAQGSLSKLTIGVLMGKTLALLVAIWLILAWTPANPVGFALGFTVALAGLVVGSVIFAPPYRRGGAGTAPNTALTTDESVVQPDHETPAIDETNTPPRQT